MNHTKVAIIGAGPAGISCAVQLKRGGIDFLLFEKNQTGGLLRNANYVENYLGFDNGVSGMELVKKFRKNLENFDISPILSEVKKVVFADKLFHIETTKGLFTSEALVVSCGTRPKKLDVPLDNSFNGEIFYEIADLDKKSFSDKTVAIIGAGDAAFDYAINLVNNYHVPKVVILNRNEKAKCIPLLEERALKFEQIRLLNNIQIENIEEINEKIVLYCMKTNNHYDKSIINTDCILAAIGRESCGDFLCDEILNDSAELQQEGLLYFIGDATNDIYRQTSIAVGEGIKAAMQISEKINY